MKNFIFLIHLLLLTLFSSLHSSPINTTCNNTPHINLCTSILLNSSNPNVETLAALIINLAIANATCTLSFIRDLIKETIDPERERPLAYCAEVYVPLVKYTLPQGAEAFDKGQYGFAKYSLSYAAKKADTCEKALSGEAGSLLGDRNKMFCELCDVAIAIINTLSRC